MSLKVILIRHGKAESASDAGDDLHRQLTREGVLALEHAFPRAFALLDLPERTECWCSSAVRARQTADIATCACGSVIRTTSGILYDQNVDELMRSLSETDAECVICVGHVPSLEHICERLCGVGLDFQPGAVCAIDIFEGAQCHISHATRPVGRLAWFVQGPVVEG